MDNLRKETDKELKRLEDDLESIYKEAEGDLREKWDKYMQRAEKRLEGAENDLKAALKSGDADAIAAARSALAQKKENVLFRDKQFRDMVDGVTERISHVNQIAAEYVNGKMPDMYRYNYNGTLTEVTRDAKKAGIDGVAFNMLDEKTVENMVKRGEVKLPAKKIDVPKDQAWNKKALNAQLLQGIIQGESIPQMSKRLSNVTNMDKEAAIRNARTMTTEAENAGRLASMEQAEEMGLQYEKVWMSTHDDRTRESHALMDGEAVPLDEKFSNGLEYPGDPNGEPEEVYNCRCSLVRKLVGYKGHSIKANSYEPTYFEEAQAEAAKAAPAASETDASEEEIARFVPAATIEEAERFAADSFVKEGSFGYTLTGQKVSFKNIDIDVANSINRQLDTLYSQYDIDKLSSLEAFGKGNRKLYQTNGEAPFITSSLGNVGMNTTLMSNAEKIAEYNRKGNEAFDYVMKNKDMLTGDALKLAEVYETAGRALVDDSLEGMVTHEVGHHISHMVNIDKTAYDIANNTEWTEYAKHLSGYANASFGEYFAESFAAYNKGETEKLQPEIIQIFEGLKKK